MKYETVDFGKGLTLPCSQLDLTGPADAPARRELKAQIYHLVDTKGGLLIRNTGIKDTRQYGEFLASIEFSHHSYVGGTNPRTEMGNGVYTAVDRPPSITIHSHQEMSYLDTIPDYVSFYCELPPNNGQKTNLFVDMREFTANLPNELKSRYRGRRARLQRTLKSSEQEAFSQGEKSWQEALGTGDHQEAALIAQERGWELTWKDDDSLVILQEPARFFRTHLIHGELWCTQAMLINPVTYRRDAVRDGRLSHVEKLDQVRAEAPDTINQMFLENGNSIPDTDVECWYDLILEMETHFALEQGEVIILDNMLVAHGRGAFEGPREMFAALGNRDSGQSTMGAN